MPEYNKDIENILLNELKQRLIKMHGSVEAVLFNLKHQVPAMRKELDELSERDLRDMNKFDLDRMNELEKQVPDLERLLELLNNEVPPEKRIIKTDEIQDLGETLH